MYKSLFLTQLFLLLILLKCNCQHTTRSHNTISFSNGPDVTASLSLNQNNNTFNLANNDGPVILDFDSGDYFQIREDNSYLFQGFPIPSYSTYFHIDDLGYVGVGTSSPTSKFHLSGASDIASPILTISDPTDYEGAAIRLDDIDNNHIDILNDNGSMLIGRAGQPFLFFNDSNSNFGVNGDVIKRTPSSEFDIGNNVSGENWDDVVANDFITFSDRRLKNNIYKVKNVLSKVLKLEPVYYQYTKEHTHDDRKRIGFIAQDVQSIFPSIITDEGIDLGLDGNLIRKKSEHLSMNYLEFIPLLTSAIQEQQNIIEQQVVEIDELKSQLARIVLILKRNGIDNVNTEK